MDIVGRECFWHCNQDLNMDHWKEHQCKGEGILESKEERKIFHDSTSPVQTRPYHSSTQISHEPTNKQRIAYVYKAKREINGSRVRVIWGRISRPHGNNGAVKSKFTSNLPAKTFGASCRIVRHPTIFPILQCDTNMPDALPLQHLNSDLAYLMDSLYTPDLIRL